MSADMGFDLLVPENAADAVAKMQANPGARYIAGGTDLLPNLRRGIGEPKLLIALDAINEMKGISETADHVVIGAAVTLSELISEGLHKRFGALTALNEVAGPGLREAATIGGNLCLDTRCIFYNQSKWWRQANGFCLKHDGEVCHVAPKGKRCHASFSGDLAPALMVLGAEAKISGRDGADWRPLGDLYLEDGLAHMNLNDEDLLVAIRIPVAGAEMSSGYLKSRIRKAIDFPLAGVAVALKCEGDRLVDLRVAVTGTNPRPILFDDFPGQLGQIPDDAALGAISKQIGQVIKPMRTTNMPGYYRRQMVEVLVKRLITKLYEDRSAAA